MQQSDTGHVSNSAPESHHMILDYTSSDSRTRHSPRVSPRLHSRGADHSSQDQRTILSSASDTEVPPYPGTSAPDTPDFATPPPSYYEVMHSKWRVSLSCMADKGFIRFALRTQQATIGISLSVNMLRHSIRWQLVENLPALECIEQGDAESMFST